MFVIALASVLAVASAGVIQHGSGGGHGHATSYQHVKIENYHPVPVYVKQEHQQFLDHPVSQGQTATSVEVNHGGHHDHGYAVVKGSQQGAGGHEALVAVADHEAAGLGGHYDQGAELAAHAVQGYDGQGAAGYEHESAGYEQAAAGYGQDAGYGHESAGYGQEAAAYAQEQAAAAAAYEQAAGANQGHHYHH